jgi:hypothetical protein
MESSSVQFVNVTITNNSANNGKGVFCDVSHPKFYNTIMYPDNLQVGAAGSEVYNNCLLWNGAPSGPTILPSGTNPNFVNPNNNDYHLNPGSPCINYGNSSYLYIQTDLDGNPRVRGGNVDLGVYEYPN